MGWPVLGLRPAHQGERVGAGRSAPFTAGWRCQRWQGNGQYADGPRHPDERWHRRRALGRVIFLGTGDPLNWERAQTCLAVPLAGGETMLLDASSGTVVLRRLEEAGVPLASVRHLFVTHRHFDHVGGLAPLLTSLASLPEARITVHALPGTLGSLRELLGLTIPGVEGWLGERLHWRGLAAGEPVPAGDAEVTPFEVDHGLECAGLRVERGGLTIAFSADTRPCPTVVEYAQDADILIHESYGTDGEAERADFLGHSTASEAGRAAREAGVRRLVLTPTCGRAASPIRASSRPRRRRPSGDLWTWRATWIPSTSERAARILRGIRPREGTSARLRRQLASEVLRLESGRSTGRSPTWVAASKPRWKPQAPPSPRSSA
jgi:ribonuclease Z